MMTMMKSLIFITWVALVRGRPDLSQLFRTEEAKQMMSDRAAIKQTDSVDQIYIKLLESSRSNNADRTVDVNKLGDGLPALNSSDQVFERHVTLNRPFIEMDNAFREFLKTMFPGSQAVYRRINNNNHHSASDDAIEPIDESDLGGDCNMHSMMIHNWYLSAAIICVIILLMITFLAIIYFSIKIIFGNRHQLDDESDFDDPPKSLTLEGEFGDFGKNEPDNYYVRIDSAPSADEGVKST